ncbi:MAG: hypothetical protein WC071_12575 [Victivallaceae bacterium]
MKIKISALIICIAGIVITSGYADEDDKKISQPGHEAAIPDSVRQARIDIAGKVNITPAKGCARAEWATGDLQNKYLCAHSNTLQNHLWQTMEISFVPEEDGIVTIKLKGIYFKPEGSIRSAPVWFEFDDIKVEGAVIHNGGFEELDDKGRPKSWKLSGKVVSAQAAEGKNAVKVWLNQPASQDIVVKKDQPVTITTKVRNAE